MQLSCLKIAFILVSLGVAAGCNAERTPSFPEMPQFTHTDASEWINSAPLTRAELKGSVVLIDVWTFACWNCYRSFPWLNQLEKKFVDQPFKIIGVHSPEFDYEKERAKIEVKVKGRTYRVIHRAGYIAD